MAVSTISYTKTPQAGDDVFGVTEADYLAGLNGDGAILLDVMANDKGGTAKTLYSIDNGDAIKDLLTRDPNLSTTWDKTEDGNWIRINNGKIEFKLAFDANTLPSGETYSDTFTYSIQLGNGTISCATVTVNIVGENDGPSLTGSQVALVAGTEDTAYVVSAANLLAGYTDIDGDTLSVANLSTNNGSVTDNGDGTFTITPSANFNGAITLSYSVIDGKGGSIAASQSYNLAAVNDAPTGAASASLAAGIEDTAYTVNAADLLAGFSDVDGDTLSVANLSASNGTVTNNGNGTFTITPSANFNGPVTLNYNVIDGNAGSVVASQSYSLAAVNDAPVTTPVTLAAIAEDSGVRLITQADLLANAADIEGDALTATGLAIASGNGSLVDNFDGTWSYTPALDDDTAVSFSYTVTDGDLSVAGSATLDISPVNDAPVTTPVTLAAIAEDSGVRVITQAQLLANASDVDGPALTATGLAISSGGGTLGNNGNGTWNYTPALNDDTAVSFSYSVSDGSLTAAGSATMDITPVNDVPTGINFTAISPGAALPVAGAVITTLSTVDVDNSSGFVYSLAAGSSGFTIDGTQLKTSAGLSENLTYTLNVQSTDAGGLSVTETLRIFTGTGSNGGDDIGSTNSPTSSGDDIIYTLSSGNGSSQKDIVFAGSGQDTLFGQNGVDELHGGDGNDVLYGGAGHDKIWGDAGSDTFVFDTALNASTNVDTVMDFDANGVDTILLSRAIFGNLTTTSGGLQAGDFGSVANGSGAAATFGAGVHVIYDSQTGNLYYDSNGGDTTSGRTLFAVLDNKPTTALFDHADIVVGP